MYHGISEYFNILTPHQAFNIEFEVGCQNAVYANSNRKMALAFALGAVPNQNGKIEWIMKPESGDVMVFEKGTLDFGGKGYLYVLDHNEFQQAMGTQWVCFHEVKPLKIIDINVNDYFYLFRVKEKNIQ